MAYRRFRLPVENVATVANVAGPEPKTRNRDHLQSVASVATVAAPEPDFAHWDEEDWRAAFEERAAILEYDGGHSHAEAERLAREEVFGTRNADKYLKMFSN